MAANFLQQLMSVFSSAPAQPQGIPQAPVYDAATERHARANGFNSANEMMLWAKQRNTPSGGTIDGSKRPSMQAAMAWHPKNILGSVLSQWRGAGGN